MKEFSSLYDQYHTQPEVSFDTMEYGDIVQTYKHTRVYINECSTPITVVSRNNLAVNCKPIAYNQDKKVFTIRDIYFFKTHNDVTAALDNIYKFRKEFPNINRLELDLIAEIFMTVIETTAKSSNKNRSTVTNVVVNRTINTDFFIDKPYTYFSDVDLLLHYNGYNSSRPHPYSAEGMALGFYGNLVTEKKVSGTFIEIIDNDNIVSNRYIYMAKKLITVNSTQDASRPSGVYVSVAETDRVGSIHVDPNYYTFDDAETSLGLYKTKEDAITGGSPDLAIKMSIKEKEEQLIAARSELEVSKTNLANSNLARQEEINNIRHQQELEASKFKTRILELEAEAMELKQSSHGNNILTEQKLLEAKTELEVMRNNIKISELNRQEELNRTKHEQELEASTLRTRILELEAEANLNKQSNLSMKELIEHKLLEARTELETVKNSMRMTELARQEELNEVKHQQDIAASKLKATIAELEAEVQERKKKNAKLKEDMEEYKSERDKLKMERKDYYEGRSYERKDASEMVKYAPALVIAAIGAAAYWYKK